MKLEKGQVSTKLRSTMIAGALTAVVVGVVAETPLAKNEWLKPLKNTTIVGNLIVLAGAGFFGWKQEETAFDEQVGQSDRTP